MLHYFAFPDPPHMPGQHGSSSGAVEVTGVLGKNVGSSPTGFELFQTWVD